MPQIFIDGRPFEARGDQTVMQVADANGIHIPRLCWHPQLSIAGNCRLCVVQVEDRSWVEISCNMPVAEGLSVRTDSELVRAHRKATMQFLTLNHPVDCGVCDKAGECTLQDYHVAYNGEASTSLERKVPAAKFYALGRRITLDNERCVLCTRCVRFTREVSKSHALGVLERGDHSVIRPAGGAQARALDDDPYSDNIVDLCPVGALLAKDFLYRDRVWTLEATPSVCPGCARGCSIDIWQRKREWAFRSPAARHARAIARVTPRANAAVNGPWVCNWARDLAARLERPRAQGPLARGRAIDFDAAAAAARALVARARRPVALVSSAGSDEELRACRSALDARFACFVKADRRPEAGEVVQDDLLIRADKNPGRRTAQALFGDAEAAFAPDTDLVLVWGEGCHFAGLPRGVPVILLGAFAAPENAQAEVFFPISLFTERSGHFTNFEGVTSAFERCFAPPPGAADAERVFAALAARRTPDQAVTP
ncbi:MAG: 2Fe-2S iron-sulfur cluster binding domain-containing protein [Comamonadaceae bacterium]|nr:2Fe-2S iron-sulfur cluster binding domain-containing protein [Comamonadaceae bacterium]